MARDGRKNTAFSSGMRGGEKGKGAGTKQAAGGKVGNPDGEQSAYSSGMRGSEKPKQKPALDEGATDATGNAAGAGSSRQGPNTSVGNPKGEGATLAGTGAGVNDGTLQGHTSDAYDMDDNSLERSAAGIGPEAHEDETHINIRVPKSSIKRASRK